MSDEPASDARLEIRLATLADQPKVICLIDSVFREYDDQIWLEGSDADLTDIAANYFDKSGAFWVLADGDHVFGCHAALPTLTPQTCTFRRLYLATNLRGKSWGKRLMENNLHWARCHGFRRVEFWSDTRFAHAHRFFERIGFVRGSEIRKVSDGWKPFEEYFYSLDLSSR